MSTVGIIAEYNPFHNGHLYHIKKIKEKYKEATIVLVMTGNFTERGDVAIIDKWKRTEIALKYGIDIVIELPYPFATQSADYFSYGGITLLEKLKVDKVIFGSESDNIEDLKIIAETQLNNDEFDKLVKIYSKMGKNYPTAISQAIYDLTEKKVETPNDLLGVSYIKTILKYNYKIKPETIKRIDNYHDTNIDNSIASATAIRNALKEGKDISKQIPKEELNYLNDLHFIEDYFPIIKYKLITEDNLAKYQTVDEGIDQLLKKAAVKAKNYDELINLVKSKRYTYNKITRMLLHILCNFTKEKAKKYDKIKYIRILGLNTKGRQYLNTIKKDIELPIISKILREKDEMLVYEIETTKIYDIFTNNLEKREFQSIIYKGEEND